MPGRRFTRGLSENIRFPTKFVEIKDEEVECPIIDDTSPTHNCPKLE